MILPTGVSERSSWTFSRGGRAQLQRLAPALSVNNLEVAIDAALDGWGITRVLSYQVADALAEGRLVELLGDAEDLELPVHLLQAEGRRAAAKIRGFIDFAAERLRGESARLLAR